MCNNTFNCIIKVGNPTHNLSVYSFNYSVPLDAKGLVPCVNQLTKIIYCIIIQITYFIYFSKYFKYYEKYSRTLISLLCELLLNNNMVCECNWLLTVDSLTVHNEFLTIKSSRFMCMCVCFHTHTDEDMHVHNIDCNFQCTHKICELGHDELRNLCYLISQFTP